MSARVGFDDWSDFLGKLTGKETTGRQALGTEDLGWLADAGRLERGLSPRKYDDLLRSPTVSFAYICSPYTDAEGRYSGSRVPDLADFVGGR